MIPPICPNCGVPLDGHPARVIGISNGDSVYAWKCSECLFEWPRIERPTPGQFRTFDVENRQ